jgi:hypothetical protein
VNLGRGDGRTAGVRGARHAAPGPGVWRPGCGDRGRHRGPAAAVAAACRRAGPVAVLDRVSERLEVAPQAGRCPVTDAGALDGARFEVAVDATGVPEAIETASGCSAMAGGWWSSVCRQPRPRSASRRSGFIATKSSSPGRWLSCAASARPDGGYRTAAASPACWPRSGTSRSDQHFITCSSHFPGRQLRSVTDLGIPPATEAISMPDSSPGIQAQVGPDCAGAGWRSRSRPGL